MQYAHSDIAKRCAGNLCQNEARRLSISAPNLTYFATPSTQRARLIEQRTPPMISSPDISGTKMVPKVCWPVFGNACSNHNLFPGRSLCQENEHIEFSVANVDFVNARSEGSLVNITVEERAEIPSRLNIASVTSSPLNDALSLSPGPCIGHTRDLIPGHLRGSAIPSPQCPDTYLLSRKELVDALQEASTTQLVASDRHLKSQVSGDGDGSQTQKRVLSCKTPLKELQTLDLQPDEDISILELSPQAHPELLTEEEDRDSSCHQCSWTSCSTRLLTSITTTSPSVSLLIEKEHQDMEKSTFVPESMMRAQILDSPLSLPSSTPPISSFLSESCSLLGSSCLKAPEELLRTPSPALTPYPSLESSATTLEFGFAPTLKQMPGTYPDQHCPSPPVSRSP